MGDLKTIRGHPNYKISSDGFIVNNKGHIMTPAHDKDGYCIVRICENGKYIKLSLHRVVAQHFIPNDDNNLPQVNHKDGDKDNCHDWNLEWCTDKYNTQHSYDTELHKVGEVIQLDKDMNEVARYKNAKIAADSIGVKHQCIIVAISRRTKSNGFYWKRLTKKNMEV